MTKAYINVNLDITEGTSLDEIIDTLIQVKDNMDKIDVKLCSAIFRTQIALSSSNEKENKQ